MSIAEPGTRKPTLLDAPEQRFPLELGVEIRKIRDLFRAATRNQWDPRTDIDWSRARRARHRRGAPHRRAHVLEPAGVVGIRRDLGKPGLVDPLLPGAARARFALLLHDPHSGGIAPRRGLLPDGRASRRVYPAAGPGRFPEIGGDAWRAQDGARPRDAAGGDHRRPGLRRRGGRVRRVPSPRRDHPEQGRQPGVAQHHARRGAALRVRLGLSRTPHPADDPRRDRRVRTGGHHDDRPGRDERLSQLLARPRIRGDARRGRGRPADLGGRARRHGRRIGKAGLRRVGARASASG